MGRQKLSEAEKEAQRKKKEIRKKELRAQMEADRPKPLAPVSSVRVGSRVQAWAQSSRTSARRGNTSISPAAAARSRASYPWYTVTSGRSDSRWPS